MLSERVLDELTRSSPLSEEICKALWPDLAVESKLQVLAAYQADSLPSTPDWLTDLALEDRSPAIQYFALRHAHLKTRREDVRENLKQFFQATDQEVTRHFNAHALEHPLAKAAVLNLNAFNAKESLRHFSPMERLAAVRNQSSFSLLSLVEFLEESLDKVDDRELAAVAWEFFLRPDTKRELKRGRSDFIDGLDAYYAGQGVTKGWEVVRKAGPALAGILVPQLPTSLGLGNVEAKDLATMPERVLEMLVYDTGDRKQIGELHRMMLDEPSRFPESVIKALERHAEYAGDYEPEEAERERQRASPLPGRCTLEAVQHLQQQVVKLTEQIQELRENPQPKRGFFG